MYKSLSALIITVLVVVPAVTSAMTRDEILSEIARLIKIVDAIKVQLRAIGIDPDGTNTGTTGSGECLPVNRSLQVGASGQDVSALQGFLIEQGVLSDEYGTGYYGGITKDAVSRWQLLSHLSVTGSIDKRTADVMKAACASGTSVTQAKTTSTGTTTRTPVKTGVAPVDNFSFTVEPAAGPAPHAVSAFFAVNGTTCTSYSLDWGDGSPIVSREGGNSGCESDQINRQLTHIYQSRGSYTVSFRTIRGYVSQAPVVSQKTITVQ